MNVSCETKVSESLAVNDSISNASISPWCLTVVYSSIYVSHEFMSTR